MKIRKVLINIIIVLLIIILMLSIYNIVLWYNDKNKIANEIQTVNNKAIITQIEDTKTTKVINNDVDKNDLYWKYIKTNLIDVNIGDLKKENADTVGWIQVGGTNINYPVVQTTNNSYYLKHSFNKLKNSAGWIFMDYRNNYDFKDNNTIIYAHGRYDKTMFGTLKNILNSNWKKNKDNYIIKYSSQNSNTLWQIFSVYIINTTTDYLTTSFENDNEYEKFINMLINRSELNFNTNITNKDSIITLSTCYNEKQKVVLHAKLIKEISK